MKNQKIFIEYIKSQKENINRLAQSEPSEKEAILNELNKNMEIQDLNVKIQELNSKVVFIPTGKERFKGRILYDFLQKIFGEKYINEFWGMMEEFENKSYVSIDSFLHLAGKTKDDENEITEAPADTGEIKKLILSVYHNIRNREFTEALKGYKKLAEERKELFDEKLKKNFEYLLVSTNSAMETDEYREFALNRENDIFLNYLNKCKKLLEEENPELSKTENIPETTENITALKTENIIPEEEKEENQIFEKNTAKSEKIHTEKIIRKEEKKPKTVKELMSGTIELFENYNFDKAVQNIKILAETDGIFTKDDVELKYLLEAVLLRTGRFFLQRKMENKRYWGYFLGKYEKKLEFYQNIVKLREYLGVNSRYSDEEYEVWRKN